MIKRLGLAIACIVVLVSGHLLPWNHDRAVVTARETDRLTIARQERAKFIGRLTPAQAPELLLAIASRFQAETGGRWGRHRKLSGNNCGGYSCDRICDGPTSYDILRDGPDATVGYAGEAEAFWPATKVDPMDPADCEFAPVGGGGGSGGTGGTTDPSAIEALQQDVLSLQTQVNQLRSDVVDLRSLEIETEALRKRDVELQAEIDLLKVKPPQPIPCMRGAVGGFIPVTVCPPKPQ